MDGSNPLETDIKVLISAPTFKLNSKFYTCINGKVNFSNQNTTKMKNRDEIKESMHALFIHGSSSSHLISSSNHGTLLQQYFLPILRRN